MAEALPLCPICAATQTTPPELSQFCKDMLQKARVARVRNRGVSERIINEQRDIWPVDGFCTDYSSAFSPLLDGSTIEKQMQARKAAGLPVNVLDLFGSGIFFKDFSLVDSSTGVRLTDSGTHESPQAQDQTKWSLVTGDLLSFQTWINLHQNLLTRSIQLLDFITIRPFYGIGGIEGNTGGYFNYMMLVRRAYQLLNPDGGMMYVQLPQYLRFIQNEHLTLLYDLWVQLLREARIKATVKRQGFGDNLFILKIERNPVSASRLPIIIDPSIDDIKN
jgi:hypothetical protein